MKELRNVLWLVAIFNIISAILFFLPPGRSNYMPPILAAISMVFMPYAIFAFTIVSLLCAAASLAMIVYGKRKNYKIEKNYIVLLILFLTDIPLGWFIFNAAMSV